MSLSSDFIIFKTSVKLHREKDGGWGEGQEFSRDPREPRELLGDVEMRSCSVQRWQSWRERGRERGVGSVSRGNGAGRRISAGIRRCRSPQEEADAGSLPGTAVGRGGKRESTAQFTQELCSNMWLEQDKPGSQSKQGEDLQCLLLQSWAGWGFHVLLSDSTGGESK